MLMDQQLVARLKRRSVNLDVLFNTKQKNKNAQATTFMVRNSVKINKGTADFANVTCNGVPMTCNSGEQAVITATYPMGVNEVFADCAYKEVESQVKSEMFSITAEEWAIEEAKYGYSTFTGEDITAEVTAETLYNQIKVGINKLIDNGYNKKDMLVVISEKLENEFQSLNLACCDLAVQMSDGKSTLGKAYGVKEVVAVPQIVINGDETNDVAFRVYVPEMHPLVDYCKIPLVIEDFNGEEVKGTRIYGRELLGAGELDAGKSEVHAFFAEAAPLNQI
jgi:hypothetical protein